MLLFMTINHIIIYFCGLCIIQQLIKQNRLVFVEQLINKPIIVTNQYGLVYKINLRLCCDYY